MGHRVYLDAPECFGRAFASRFPAIAKTCKAAGIDPAREPIPIRPAAHYHMGGIAVDIAGRSSVEGLWACGEAACTGLHGANRLASNSLLEAAVLARDVAHSVAGVNAGSSRPPALIELPPEPNATGVRPIVSATLGLVRNGRDIARAIEMLLPTACGDEPESDPAVVALMIAVASCQRRESRGAHYRTDFSAKADVAIHSRFTLAGALEMANEIAVDIAPRLARSA
jgi:L-aspartate oxidase